MAVATGSSNIIEIPYTPRPFWRDVLHPALEKYRFSVIVAHRRFGKSVGSVNHLIKSAVMKQNLRSPRYAYLAPFLKQAKMIAWEYLKFYTSKIPDVKVNESELYVELPSYYKDASGARIYIIGADRPNGLRGTYWDGVVIDEYAQIRKELWGEVIRPALSDRHGWAVFIGTPKGQNQFYDIYMEAQKKNDWFAFMATVKDTNIIPEDELKSMMEDMTPDEIEQELYCNFMAKASNVLIQLGDVNDSMERELDEVDYKGMPKIMGVDVARFGDDRSVISYRQGLMVFEPDIYENLDNMTFAGMIARKIDEWDPDMVFVDSGRGEGVIDRLRQLGYRSKVVEVPFGGAPIERTRYVNKRAEMWDAIRQWLNDGGKLPYIPQLRKELTTPTYSFDGQNRIKLQSKEQIKDISGKSPDIADSLALTFAYPISQSRSYLYRKAKRDGKIFRYGAM